MHTAASNAKETPQIPRSPAWVFLSTITTLSVFGSHHELLEDFCMLLIQRLVVLSFRSGGHFQMSVDKTNRDLAHRFFLTQVSRKLDQISQQDISVTIHNASTSKNITRMNYCL